MERILLIINNLFEKLRKIHLQLWKIEILIRLDEHEKSFRKGNSNSLYYWTRKRKLEQQLQKLTNNVTSK